VSESKLYRRQRRCLSDPPVVPRPSSSLDRATIARNDRYFVARMSAHAPAKNRRSRSARFFRLRSSFPRNPLRLWMDFSSSTGEIAGERYLGSHLPAGNSDSGGYP